MASRIPAAAPGVAATGQPLPLRHLLTCGVVDAAGLAFGWTIVLLVLLERNGLGAAALLAAAMLIGIALSAPFSAWLSSRLAPRELLRLLAVTEGVCRLVLLDMLWLGAAPWLMAPVVVLMNLLAWSAFAGMRAEVRRSGLSRAAAAASAASSSPIPPSGSSVNELGGMGRPLTIFAVAVAVTEAAAAAAAAAVLDLSLPTAVPVVLSAVYVLALLPQWWVGGHADPVLRRRRNRRRSAPLRPLVGPAALGAGVFLVCGAPALLATVLAYERYGIAGVAVSAVAFTVGSLSTGVVQAQFAKLNTGALPVLVLGAVMVGGWSFSGFGLAGLAVAQACAGLAQGSLEGDLDTRMAARVRPGTAAAALGMAASARALGGALSVALLPLLLHRVSLPVLSATAALGLLVAAAGFALAPVHRRLRERDLPASFAIGFAAGVVTGVAREAAGRVRETGGDNRPSFPAWGRRWEDDPVHHRDD